MCAITDSTTDAKIRTIIFVTGGRLNQLLLRLKKRHKSPSNKNNSLSCFCSLCYHADDVIHHLQKSAGYAEALFLAGADANAKHSSA